jgi:hypothetical protein
MAEAMSTLGDRVIHIGAPKCGSTALQSAFYQNRDALHSEGVTYIGESSHWINAAKAVTEVADRISGKNPPISEWERLLREVRAVTSGTALISSEWFSAAKEGSVQRIVNDLDAKRLHAVLVIRPLTSTLPSAWQQGLKLGGRQGLSEWLDTILNNAEDPRSKRVWSKHRYDRIAQRWVAELGRERVTVVVANESDPAFIFTAFGQILGLTQGTLSAPPKRTNPSLSAFEADALAELNKIYFERGGTMYAYRSGVLRTFDGYVNSLRDGSIQRSTIPAAALPAVQDLNVAIAGDISKLGCRVIGDLDRFARAQQGIDTSTTVGAAVAEQRSADVRSAAGMMYALMITTGIAETATPLPGFGKRRSLLYHQGRSFLSRTKRTLLAGIARRLP